MDKLNHNNNKSAYPEFIRDLPEVEVPIEGVRGWLLESEQTQVVFFEISSQAVVPPHSHCAQWGVMLEGRMDLTIDGNTLQLTKGDNYYIPEGAEHSAKFHSFVSVIDFFDAPDRYKCKE